MRKLTRFAAWCGSDWRLPLTIAAAVLFVFLLSRGLFEFVVDTHKAYLQSEHDRGMADIEAKSRAILVERAKEKAPQFAGREVPPGFGL